MPAPSWDKKVCARTGATLWSYRMGNFTDSSPAVADGVVYVGSDYNMLHALDARTGATETVLHRFPDGNKDGYDPAEGLTWGKWGDLYGAAPYGGIDGCLEFGCGTVFELQP
jgi:hypothetical protein